MTKINITIANVLFGILVVFSHTYANGLQVENWQSVYGVFIKVRVETCDQVSEYVVTGDWLLRYLDEQKGINAKKFPKYISNVIKYDSVLKIQIDDSHYSRCVTFNHNVIHSAQRGKEYFIKRYFNKSRYMRRNVANDEISTIIAILFKWRIYVKIDCESGRMIITKV